MKIARMLRLVLPIIVILGAAIAAPLLLRTRDYVRVSMRIETVYRDPRAWLGYITVDENGTVYTLERISGKHFYSAYTPRGARIWHVEDPQGKGSSDVLVDFPGRREKQLGAYTGTETGWNIGGHRLVTVNERGRITSKPLKQTSDYAVAFVCGVSTPSGLYAAGSSDEANMVASKFDNQGEERWIRLDMAQGWYNRAAVDARENLIVAGEPAGIIGTRIASYSPEGKRLWFEEIHARDAAATVWLDTDKHNNILAIVRLHNIVGLKDEAEVDRYMKLGSKHITGSGAGFADESGHDQDYVLLTYDSRGKQTGKKALSHGARLLIENAQVSDSGEIYIVGNRQKVNRYGFPTESDGAEIIKCNPRGDIIWSRRIRLPDSCLVKGITVTNNGGIYIYGDSQGYLAKEPASLSRLFVYKVVPD